MASVDSTVPRESVPALLFVQDQEWKNGLCNCGGCGPCMGAFFCWPCLFGKTQHRLEMYPDQPDPTFNYCNFDCGLALLAGCFGVPCVATWLQRSEQRSRFGIKGNMATDFLVALVCTPCAQAQQELDVKQRAEDAALSRDGLPSRVEKRMNYNPPSSEPFSTPSNVTTI